MLACMWTWLASDFHTSPSNVTKSALPVLTIIPSPPCSAPCMLWVLFCPHTGITHIDQLP